MGRRSRSARGRWIAAASWALCAGLPCLQGCAVPASDSCAEKAICPGDDGPAAVGPDATFDDHTEASGDDSSAPPPAEGGGDATMPDAPSPGEDAADASDASPDRGAPSEAAAPESGADADAAAPRDATVDAPSDAMSETEDGAADASDASDAAPEAAPVDAGGCNPLAPDCSDPTCTPAFACAPAVPAGWTGPAVLFNLTSAGVPAPSPPACPTSPQYGTVALDGHDVASPQGTCSCTCGMPTGTCNGPTVTIYHGGACASQCQNVNNVGAACARGCASSDALSGAVTAAPTPAGGSCTASLTSTLVPFDATDWTTTGRVCGASRSVSQSGCAANQVCADAPPAGSSGQAWCVFQAGAVACPTGYGVQHVYFAGAQDTRACAGTCACGAATGMTCTVDSVSVSATSDCAAPATFASTAVGTCNQNLAATARNVTASVTASGGSCAPSGNPSVAGGVTPTGATTVCCTQ